MSAQSPHRKIPQVPQRFNLTITPNRTMQSLNGWGWCAMGQANRGKGWRVGELHHNAKLTDDDVDLIIELREKYKLTYKAIGEKFDVTFACIYQICSGLKRSRLSGRIKPERH
jgi:hypothetical protein